VSLSRFIYALGIPQVGEATAHALSQHFCSLDRLISADLESLTKVPDIGPVVAVEIRQFFDDSENRKDIDTLVEKLNIQEPESDSKAVDSSLSGKKFVITGTLETLSRDQAKRRIQSAGGRVIGTVSAKTDYLVCGSRPGSKLDMARKLGVKIIDEDQFLKLFQQ
ncbi:MAG: NAD-dependent DNA ligase LigA, partial [Gammaproteobacteria bacterium]